MQIVNNMIITIKNINSLFKVVVLPLLCLLFIKNLNAQEFQDNLEKRSYLSFNLDILTYQQSTINNNFEGGSYVKSNASLSFKSALKFNFNLKKNLYFNTGFGFTLIPFNYNFTFNDSISNELAPIIAEDETFFNTKTSWLIYTQWAVTNDLSLSNKFKLKKNKFLNIEIGLRTYFLPNQSHVFGGGKTLTGKDGENIHIDVFDLTLEPKGAPQTFRFLTSYLFNIGIEKQLINKNLFGLHLNSNYVPSLLSEIEFEFSNLQNERNGNGKQFINNIGVTLSYSILFKKNKEHLKI